MDVLNGRRVLLFLLLVLVCVERSECVRCFASFSLGQCDEELGEVEEEDCCQNSQSGFQREDGVCRSCGPAVWSDWSSWSQCSTLCGAGVKQQSRKCFGYGECDGATDIDNKLQTKPCTGTCCDDRGWGVWLPWSPCSVTCAEGGVRRRERICSVPECLSACSGASSETEECPVHACPVHGGWSGWSGWSQCSGSCIDDITAPSRVRHRFCSSPPPSSDTLPPGNSCQGDGSQVEPCTQLPNCPVDGGWGAWSAFGPCSVSCGEGLQLSLRTCDSPAPKYGGKICEGTSTRSNVCQSPCPVHGFWSGWSLWSDCSSSCIPQGPVPSRTRRRSCSNPAPSSSPPGNGCQGEGSQSEDCVHLPHCQVDGSWGSWSAFSACPVSCGLGLQLSDRKCDSPTAKHGGRPCVGDARRTNICKTNVHCPVNGRWSEWGEWDPCLYPFGDRAINCKRIGGLQSRRRECLHQAHDGDICSGDLSETRVCYDVDKCYLKGTWDGFEEWGFCRTACGKNSKSFRLRHCKPDYSEYSPTIGRKKEKANFFGKPTADCGDVPDGGKKYEIQECLNVPACP